MKQGALFFDETADRYDIRFDLADYYGGLHCGECLEVFTGGKWKPTRMEYGNNWYLAGVRAEDLNADAHFLRPKAAQHITPRKEDGKCKMKSTKKSLPYP